MGVETIPGTDRKYGLISYDKDGRERAGSDGKKASAEVIAKAGDGKVTDIFFFCHGWKGDVPAARDQYNRWMGALMKSSGLAKAATVFPGFTPLLAGLHWPSQPWGDEDLGESGTSFGVGTGKAKSADALVEQYANTLGDDPKIVAALRVIVDGARKSAGVTELPDAMRKAYMDLNKALGLDAKGKGLGGPPDADREGFDPDEAVGDLEQKSFDGLNLGGLLAPLRQLSYWTMKKRARSIGEGGIHTFLIDLQKATAAKSTRIHLMGHSFGTIVISSMIGGPDAKGPLARPIDSVTLVQGAVSLWCYANDIPYKKGTKGYFNRILVDGKVRGPISVTKSKHDKAVGTLYPFASRIHGTAAFPAVALPEYGAIGAFGIQGAEPVAVDMADANGTYSLQKKKVYNVESSKYIAKGGGASGAHSDIDGPQVAHLIWETAFASR
jgi:hypothetical protein